ncbi:MAG: penicillin-binding transpeptidase domain-containing protein [Anaerovorax sp.]|nr:penicillin-binding transpeptidase domain-containing protein [Anaerovorax sp.]
MIVTNNKNRKRLIFIFACTCFICTLLIFRVGWIQVVASERYAKMAVEQQTNDVPIPAKRGVILDRYGKELAISAVTNTIWVRPKDVTASAKTKEEKELKIDKTAKTLSEILSLDEASVRETITKNKLLVRVAKYVDKEKADQIRNAKLSGISIAEDVKRYYPLGSFASHILGSTTDDNRGLSGVELKYDKYLSGVPGRWIKDTDLKGDGLSYGMEKYFQAEDGLNVVLTIDEVIQHYVEKALDQVQADTQATQVWCIVMDPKTGEILAMAMSPDYDPNNARVPLDPQQAAYVESLSDAEKQIYWNQMWRNPMISDTYDPGSTFKLITTSIALEERVTSPTDKFVCKYYYEVAGTMLHCWRKGQPHGEETLAEAVQNSCNPVFIQLAQRVGLDKYYEYLDLFGLTEKTGIDYPGEGNNILQKKETAGPVGLATMSYGQGIAVTPISLITAISAIGNDGKLMEPHLVKEMRDSDGNVVQKIEPKVVRQVISKQTAEEMRTIMESVVAVGSGGNAKISGYRIGGKTGTANKVINGKYSDNLVCSSFVGMAPMEDPQLAILLVVDEPQGVHYGSQTAAPGVKAILEETLRYLNIAPQYSEEEQKEIDSQMTVVPNVTGANFSEAIGVLGGKSLQYTVSPARATNDDFAVVDQYPKAGEKVPLNTNVYLYSQ